MDLGPGGLSSPGPSGFGGGYNATTSPDTGGGNGGDNPPIVARPDYVVTNTVPDNYFTPSKTQYGIVRAANYLLNPEPVTKYAINELIKNQYEKELQTAQDILNAQLSGSQYFGPTNRTTMQSYKNVVGGFPTPDPTINTGGDNIIPKLPVIAQTPTDINGTLSDFDLYMQGITSADPYRFTLDPRFAAAEGGVARQAYGLGSLVRKATKGIKKILKSDVGKAALLYGLGTYLGGTTAFGGSGKLSAWQRFKDPKLLKNLASPQFLTSGETTSALSTVTPTTGADAVTAPFGRLNLEAAKTAAEAAKPTPTLIDKAVTYAKENPFSTVFGLSSLAGLSTAGEEDESLDGISDRTDTSGLKELIASYPALRFQVRPEYQLAAKGGRIGYEDAGMVDPDELPMSKEGSPMFTDTETGEEVGYPYNEEMSSAPNIDAELYQMYLDAIGSGQIPRATTFDQYKELMSDRMGAKEGGLMDLGGMEKDYRAEGGFVPIGKEEKADDVPARLSKNEFVFTADAVRSAGDGDIDKGAEVMYNVMKNLESGGKISDESQGLQGARDMFQTSKRLGEIL